MEQKRVSFKVAKAIKEVGYPQEECDEYLNKYGAKDAYLGYNIARPYAMPHKKQPETKYDKKKCKSCKYFTKGGKGILGTCNEPFQHIKAVAPLDIACNMYQKRKK